MKKLLLPILLISVAFVKAQDNTEKAKEVLSSFLKSHYDKDTDFGGLNVGVSMNNCEVFGSAVGLSDVETNTQMTTDALMPGGSTGKIYFSSLAMILVTEGKLKLDDPVSKYLGTEKWYSRLQNYDKITVRNLLQHTTGISRYVFDSKFQEELKVNPDRVWLSHELLSYVFDLEPLFEPGTDFSYSDTNYIILSIILEKITGNNLYDEIERRILIPHDIKKTIPQTNRTAKNLIPGYNSDTTSFYPGKVSERETYKYNYQFEGAGGGYLNNSLELAKMGKLIYEGKIFDESIFPEYFKGINAKELRGEWGLGVHITQTPSGTAYGHSGFFPGYITNMIYFKDHGICIAVQINTSDYPKLMLYGKFMRNLHDLIAKLSEI